MKKYYSILVGLAIILVVGGSWWLNGEYNDIKSQLIEEKKVATLAHVTEVSKGLITAEDFNTTDTVKQQENFENFWYAIQSPEIVRIKAWDSSYKIIWSELPEIIGQTFPDNTEVGESLEGDVELEFSAGRHVEGFSERNFVNVDEMNYPDAEHTGYRRWTK